MSYNIDAMRKKFQNANIAIKFQFIEHIRDAKEATLTKFLQECIWELAKFMHDTDAAFRDYAREYGFAEKYAQRETAEAYYLMGCIYLHEETDTNPVDYEKVAYWLKRAVDLQHPKAMSKLAGAHFMNLFSGADKSVGAKLVEDLAHPPHSDPIEMMHWGVINYHGRHDCEQDKENGMNWITKGMDIILDKGIEISFEYCHELSKIMLEQGVQRMGTSEGVEMLRNALYFANKSLDDEAGMKVLSATAGQDMRPQFTDLRNLVMQVLNL
ncbi:MAG: hypothetical protein FWC16_07705 [Defluviitaleaceae bacterium]|nr:hypothetical protein [Defluviitaleaceae bacterium]MCL2274800.1 hypothetical protein [Defluviitaleaceae bacterium]